MPTSKRVRSTFGSCLQRFAPTTDFQSNLIFLDTGRVKRITGLSCSIVIGDPTKENVKIVGRIAIIRGKLDENAFVDPVFDNTTGATNLTEFDILFDAEYNSQGYTSFGLGSGIEVGAEDAVTIIQSPVYDYVTGMNTPGKGFIQGCRATLNASGILIDALNNKPTNTVGLR